MNHQDHVNLLRDGVTAQGGTWADLGSGSGAFTLALADLIGTSGEIYSIDKDGRALHEQERALKTQFPEVRMHYQQADFTHSLNLPQLDGIVMANSLHFHRQKLLILHQIRDYLKDGGHFILVEYNVDKGNYWVPYPLSYSTWESLASEAGFRQTRFLARVSSRFLHEIFSAVSVK